VNTNTIPTHIQPVIAEQVAAEERRSAIVARRNDRLSGRANVIAWSNWVMCRTEELTAEEEERAHWDNEVPSGLPSETDEGELIFG
jgi:hypothetical protein